MEKKYFPMTLTHYPDYRNNEPDNDRVQVLQWNENNFTGGFFVYNMNDCPEDATIARELFTAYDFIDAVRLGIDLYRQGYCDLNITEVTEEQED